MGRRPKYSRRCYLTLEPADADALDVYAREEGLPAATAAARLLLDALRRAMSPEADELAAARRRVAVLETEKDSLQRRLRAANAVDQASNLPRWEWPVEDLLADRDWWELLLPRLYEVLGRQTHVYDPSLIVADDRGYVDLLGLLFPAIREQAGAVAEWHSREYPAHAKRHWQHHAASSGIATEIAVGCQAAAMWEPVVRHVAKALSALEITSAPGADPILCIRAEDDIAGAWLRTLRRLTGADRADLPRAL